MQEKKKKQEYGISVILHVPAPTFSNPKVIDENDQNGSFSNFMPHFNNTDANSVFETSIPHWTIPPTKIIEQNNLIQKQRQKGRKESETSVKPKN